MNFCAVLVVSIISSVAALEIEELSNISQQVDYDVPSQLPQDVLVKPDMAVDNLEDIAAKIDLMPSAQKPSPIDDIGHQVADNLEHLSDITSDLDNINREFGGHLDNLEKNVDQTVQKTMSDANATLTQLSNDAFDRVDKKLDDIETWFEENLPLIIVIAVAIFVFTLMCYICYFCCIFVVCPSACCFGVRTLCRNFCCCCCDFWCRGGGSSDSKQGGGIAVTKSSGCSGCKGYVLV